jgi:6-phosphofructokinase 1
MINPKTQRMLPRKVDVNGAGYECARRYMIRLDQADFDKPHRLARLAETAGMSVEEFRRRFEYLVANG